MAAPGAELLAMQAEVEARARDAGLAVPEIRYEVVDHRELNEIAAYAGFPVRYPHWRFGMEYDRLAKGHAYGLQRIYELVVNTRPVVAYLLRQNSPVEQKLVMAHVCGHADFFHHNVWFAHTEPHMMDAMASHGARVRSLGDRVGFERVEALVDRVASVDNLVDAGAMAWGRGAPGNAPPLRDPRGAVRVAPGDILGHVLVEAPLDDWEHEIVALLRDEAYYFQPQILTKIMNEGWASYWHSRLMTGSLLRDAEVVDYADRHSGAMGGDDGPKNPYKLGLELYRHVEATRGGGLDTLFEVRAVHNDLTFVDNVMDDAYCRAAGMARTAEECAAVRESVLASLTNGGQPVIRRVAGSEGDDLELEHCWSGAELQLERAEQTLRNLSALWRKGLVRLYTRHENRALLLSCAAGGEITREYGEVLAGPEAESAVGS